MICPRCSELIDISISLETIKKAKALRKKGFSFRDIESLLKKEGIRIPFSSLARKLKRLEQSA